MTALDQRTLSVINPATEELVAEVPVCGDAELDDAFTRAAAAQPGWAADEEARRQALRQLAEAIPAAAGELTELLMSETGKPRKLASLEPVSARLWCEWFAEAEIPTETIADDAAARIRVKRRPLGVVAAITPWNFPISSLVVKLAPALLAGNTVVAKSSPFTPLAARRLGELIDELLPRGVVQVLAGDDAVGEAMTRHPVPRKITFTGSIASGKSVAATAGGDLKRVTLELGGNDAAIVLDDADVAVVAPALLTRALFNAGQTCAIPKRVFAPASRYDELVDAFAAAADAIELGTDMGPLSTRPQYDRIRALVAEALAGGATAVSGGEPLDRHGYWFEPTILTGVAEGLRIVDEEQFGPAVPVLRYDSIDEAVDRANATMYGLCGSVWTSDPERGRAVAERLECGVSYVNSHGVHRPSSPMCGSKWSGVGVEHGIAGLLEFTDRHVVFETHTVVNTAIA